LGLITGYRKVTGKHLSLDIDEFSGWSVSQPAHIREVLTGLFQLLEFTLDKDLETALPGEDPLSTDETMKIPEKMKDENIERHAMSVVIAYVIRYYPHTATKLYNDWINFNLGAEGGAPPQWLFELLPQKMVHALYRIIKGVKLYNATTNHKTSE